MSFQIKTKNFPIIQLSLKITSAICIFFILLFVCFTCILRWSLNNEKSRELSIALEKIHKYIEESNEFFEDNNSDSFFLELPYFISYSIFNSEKVISSNNNFLPKLPETFKKAKHYKEKNFYMDGDLDVLYMSSEIKDEKQNLFIQVAIDIENDSATKMIFYMPTVIPIIIIPVAILTFLILFFFIRNDFEREHAFSSNVSHELQTPVNAILGHANLLNRWGKDDAKQMEISLKAIINEAHSMKSIITNLLQITKLEKGMIKPKKEQIFVHEFFDSIKNEFKYEKNLIIETKNAVLKESEKSIINSDKELLHQIFIIAISNSLKFSPIPCKVEFRFFIEGKKSVFEIEDNGRGFLKEDLPHIFERFYRGDKSHTRTKGGSGLGLSIAKSISNALETKIKAYNSKNGNAVIRLEIF